MTNKKKQMNRLVTALLFIIFSLILFVNNTTQLLTTLNIPFNMNIVAWVGIIGVVIYAIWKAEGGEL